MLGLTPGELGLVALLVFAVVSARFWPAAGARLAERLLGGGGRAETEPASDPADLRKSERTNGTDST
jgi:hypothetical protein